MYRYPERGLRVEEFDCQLPPDALAELTAAAQAAQPPNEPQPSQPSVHHAVPGPAAVISPPKARLTGMLLFVGVVSAIVLTAMITTALNHSRGAGSQVWAECTASRGMTIVASPPVTAQPAQPPAQPEVQRASPVDTVEVRRAELVVPRAELLRLPVE
jgi:predicted small secreted protein